MFPSAKAAKEGQPRELTPGQLNELRATIKNLDPGHSRIFVHRELVAGAAPPARELEAFLQSVRLAQQAGANVNLTFWGQGPIAGKAKLQGLKWPESGLLALAAPEGAAREVQVARGPDGRKGGVGARGADAPLRQHHQGRPRQGACITQATIQNEPNGVGTDIAVKGIPRLSMRMYEWLYRLLDKELRKLPDPQNQAPNAPGRDQARSAAISSWRATRARTRG